MKLLSNFFCKLRELNDQDGVLLPGNSYLFELEQYLKNNVKDKLPCLKLFTEKYLLSVSTIKRQFKKKYGVNISTYFMNKKMEYAQMAMREGSIDFSEAAKMVGYSSVHNFKCMFKKYINVYFQYKDSSTKRA